VDTACCSCARHNARSGLDLEQFQPGLPSPGPTWTPPAARALGTTGEAVSPCKARSLVTGLSASRQAVFRVLPRRSLARRGVSVRGGPAPWRSVFVHGGPAPWRSVLVHGGPAPWRSVSVRGGPVPWRSVSVRGGPAPWRSVFVRGGPMPWRSVSVRGGPVPWRSVSIRGGPVPLRSVSVSGDPVPLRSVSVSGDPIPCKSVARRSPCVCPWQAASVADASSAAWATLAR
jgi:hypothetical protein